MAQEHEGHRKRVRERFLKEGLQAFAAHEVLELILFYAIPQRNVNPLAHALLEHFGSLHGVLDADVESLQKVEGVGEYAAALLSLFSGVSARLLQSRAGDKPLLRNRKEAQEYCVRLLDGLRQEHLYVLCLNGQMEVIANALIARGSLSEVPAYSRLVAEAALRHNAHSVVLCHNHPGGSLLPSQDDLDTTRRLGSLLHSIEVVLIDHIIVADGQAFSLSANGLLNQMAEEAPPMAADSAGQVRIRDQIKKTTKA